MRGELGFEGDAGHEVIGVKGKVGAYCSDFVSEGCGYVGSPAEWRVGHFYILMRAIAP